MMESKAICVTDGSVKNWAEAVFIVFYRLFMHIFDCSQPPVDSAAVITGRQRKEIF